MGPARDLGSTWVTTCHVILTGGWVGWGDDMNSYWPVGRKTRWDTRRWLVGHRCTLAGLLLDVI